MAHKRVASLKQHHFRNKLILNQWLISLFGIDSLQDNILRGQLVRPFHVLAEPIRDPRMEGLDADNLHRFYHNLVNSNLFFNQHCTITREELLKYEENIVRHTLVINERRSRPVVWKYYQWLNLLFVEIYLDRYFNQREELLGELNAVVDAFNRHWVDYTDVRPYQEDDLNKLCLQNATGSGKTLIMHVNLLQFCHYARLSRKDKELNGIVLLTPNESLSEQHLNELRESGFQADIYGSTGMFATGRGLTAVDIIEITKLADKQGPNTFETRSLGDQNLLLVDEGHRGMSSKEEGAWFTRRSALCARGFTFEYSATFEQAVTTAKSSDFEDSYARSVIFDYSYRWFYEDGFGKDYQILNLPDSFSELKSIYLTACLLKYYQQLCIYEDKQREFELFNLEKPLWVFVGSSVSKAKGSKDETVVATDVAQIVQFIADFLAQPDASMRRIQEILTGTGQDSGLLDRNGIDIFAGAFRYLADTMNKGKTVAQLHREILQRLFNNPAGGDLELCRIKGDSGEIVLSVGAAEEPFGLINVGDAKGLCDHIEEVAALSETRLNVTDSDFSETLFSSIKDSASPINLLVGSKKFVEGWDCWRVSTMGLMHVGKNEGTQIIQLFGRGVRLKGYDWSLKRSGHSLAPTRPQFIEDLETLNVFGIEADFMEKFRQFLQAEGLPGNERRETITLPLNVTYDIGKKLKILRPRVKSSVGREYDFKKDGPVPSLGEVPSYLNHNRVVVDWYPRIQAIASRGGAQAAVKEAIHDGLPSELLEFLDYDLMYFELERFKRERSWHNLNISRESIRKLLANPSWYTLFIPLARLNPTNFDGILLLQQVAVELLKRYCEHYYNYEKRRFIEPRLELVELTREDENFPDENEYQLIVDGSEAQLIQHIKQIKQEIEGNCEYLRRINEPGDLKACKWGVHLYQPLFHVRPGGKITVLPVSLNRSEYQFVEDMKNWCDAHADILAEDKVELYLLRNQSRGKGVGFFEAGNFYPDFILWMLTNDQQYVSFIDPHGLQFEGPGSEKVLFYQRIKDIENRLGDSKVVLNSFIISPTLYHQLNWGIPQEELEQQHVLFMYDDREKYIEKMFNYIK